MTAHWSEKYVGRSWSKSYDCADLVAEVARDRFGVSIALPNERAWRRTAPEAVAVAAGKQAYETSAPRDGDAALMRIRGNKMSIGSHIGIYCEVAGQPWVLHNLETIGVIFTPKRRLIAYQLEIVGFYRWTAA